MEGARMAENVQQLRLKPGDSEKITVNLGYVDLGHIDLMVQEGFYSNRTDFIRTAIRNQIELHADVVKQSTARKSLDLGLRKYSREDLEAARRHSGLKSDIGSSARVPPCHRRHWRRPGFSLLEKMGGLECSLSCNWRSTIGASVPRWISKKLGPERPRLERTKIGVAAEWLR